MSRRNQLRSAGAESILQKKRTWLIGKIEEVDSSYSDTLDAFVHKLNAITADPIDVARELLNRPDNALTLVDIALAGNMLQECNSRLFDILLAVCRMGETRQAPSIYRPMELMPAADHAVAEAGNVAEPSALARGADYMQLEPVVGGLSVVCQDRSLRYSFEDEAATVLQNENNHGVGVEAASANESGNAQYVLAETDMDQSVLSSIRHPDELFSTPRRCGADSGVAAAENLESEKANSPKDVYRSFSTDEHYRDAFHGTVSDVVSPDQFSIQPNENKTRIQKLEKDLNQFYKDRSCHDLDDLQISTTPQAGDYCAVVYRMDHNWYRAIVKSLTSLSTILVEYIDYGNEDEVSWRSAFKLHSQFQKLPSLSLQCSLADVIPVNSKLSGSNGKVEWERHVVEWFDGFIYGRSFQVVPVDVASSVIQVELVFTDQSPDNKSVSRSVAEFMVEEGMALFAQQPPSVSVSQKDLEKMWEKRKNLNGRGKSLDTEMNTDNCAQCPAPLADAQKWPDTLTKVEDACHSSAQSKSCIPAGMEDTCSAETLENAEVLGKQQPVEKAEDHWKCSEVAENKPNFPNKLKRPKVAVSSSIADQISGNDNSEEEALARWNPMAEDYASSRNCYEVDDENACTVTEGFDPGKIKICTHYVKGRCWNGSSCVNSHPRRNEAGEFKIEVPTFAGFKLTELELKEGSWSLVRLMRADPNGTFYVHVVKVVDSMQECMARRPFIDLPEISTSLKELMKDMTQYYMERQRKLNDLVKPTPGEVYAVHSPEEKCFYRGMVTNVGISAQHLAVTVHLVDLGRDKVVLTMYLHPMHQSFMHLSKQAVQCCIWDAKPSALCKLQELSKQAKKPYLAMKVRSRCDRTGGPLNVSLYIRDGDKLRHIDSS